MTNYVELIAEADVRRIRQETHTHSVESDGDLIARLVAAVRELAPPEGWRVTEWSSNNAVIAEFNKMHWEILLIGQDDPIEEIHFSTASAAMAALKQEQKE